jgi:hypothetical protein
MGETYEAERREMGVPRPFVLRRREYAFSLRLPLDLSMTIVHMCLTLSYGGIDRKAAVERGEQTLSLSTTCLSIYLSIISLFRVRL